MTGSDHSQIIGALDATKVPRFAGPGTFARIPDAAQVHDYDIALLGVPFDGGTSYRPGARFGPMGIRQASRHLRPSYHVDLQTAPLEQVQVVDAGDVPVTPFSIDEAVEQIHGVAGEVLGDRDRRIVALGGDHTVVLPLLRAVKEKYGTVSLIHFDAHLDTWDTYFNAPVTHGTVLRRAFEEGLLLDSGSVHIGIRGPIYHQQDLVDDESFGFRIVRAGDLDVMSRDEALEIIHTRVRDNPVYISVDIDVLDPAFAPGTGTPEAGGLSSRELLSLLRGLDGLPIVGADVVEVAPPYDHAETTCVAAATVAFDIVTMMSKHGPR